MLPYPETKHNKISTKDKIEPQHSHEITSTTNQCHQ